MSRKSGRPNTTMRTTRVQILLASLVVCALAATSARAQTAEANYKFERGFPVADTAKLNEVGIVMATSPRQQFGAANADTPYAITTLDLKTAGPMVVELPPGPFI